MRVRSLAVAALVVLAGCDGGSDAPPSPSASASAPTTSATAPEGSAQPSASPPTTDAPASPPATTTPDVSRPGTTSPATTVPDPAVPVTTTPTQPASRPSVDELLASSSILNIAHAGGDQEWPHSTFFAYDNAVAAGAVVLEMDVQLTGDGVLIVQHDETVDRTTNATGRVDGYTFDEITALDAGYQFADGCWSCPDQPAEAYIYRGIRTGERPAPTGASADDFRIVSFAEVVQRYPGVAFDIEIKGSAEASAATAAQLAAEIEQFGLSDHVVVVSFDDATVDLFHEIAPDVEVSPGVGAMSAWLLDGAPLADHFRIVQVPPMFGEVAVITPEFWDAVADAGVAVWMWPNDASTQENAEFYQEMIDQGVTGIIAGRPSAVPTGDTGL